MEGLQILLDWKKRHKSDTLLVGLSFTLSDHNFDKIVDFYREIDALGIAEDVYVAIRDAFDAAARQLEDHSRKAAGRVKAHEVPPHGKVTALHAYEGYGFVTLADGQEVYFHKNAVVNGAFDKIDIGDEVRVVLVEGESVKGPQATTVTPIGKHHLTGR